MEIFEARPASSVGYGRTAVVAMVAVGLLAAGFAWWWNFNRGRRALEFYGSEGATLVRTAKRVELLRTPPDEPLDLSKAPGLLNARAALLSDASFEWEAQPRLESPLFTVRFGSSEKHVDLTFDFENRTIKTSSTGRAAVLNRKMADGWQQYLARQMGPLTVANE
jgi:hypothetical protein